MNKKGNNKIKIQPKNNLFDYILHIKYTFPNNFKEYVKKNSSNNDFILFCLTNDKQINKEIKSILNIGEYFIDSTPKLNRITSFLFKIEIDIHIKFIEKLFFLEKNLMVKLEICFDGINQMNQRINLNQIIMNYDIKYAKIDNDSEIINFNFSHRIYSIEENLSQKEIYIDYLNEKDIFNNLIKDLQLISSSVNIE